MAELLIRIVDKVNRDSPYKDVKCLKKGDVVSVCPDGWPWTPKELESPWMVVKCPEMSMEEAEAFLVREPGDRFTNRMLQSRQFKVDVDAITRTPSVAELRAAKRMKPPIPDPNVIGDDPRVIG